MTATHARKTAEMDAQTPTVRVVCSAPWRTLLQRDQRGRVQIGLRRTGNVVYLPAPIAAYRLHHTMGGTAVEIVSRNGHVTHIERCRTPAAARSLLALVWADQSRPVLEEIFDADFSEGAVK